MTLLTGETEVFAGADGQACVVVSLARGRPALDHDRRAPLTASIVDACGALSRAGWVMSTHQLFTGVEEGPWVYSTGFAHDIDIVGVFEAPSKSAALAGIDAIEDAGWAEMFVSEWLTGPREFAPAPSPANTPMDRDWGFVALWKWNDAWQRASKAQRAEYDIECDVAFAADLGAGINIAGRHRLDWASPWHHLGVWESPTYAAIDTAMCEHERVADFKFTTSRHYIGRRVPLIQALGGAPHA
jgi:hypothetical protein